MCLNPTNYFKVFFSVFNRQNFAKSYKHQELLSSFYNSISLILLDTAFSFTNAIFHALWNFFFLHEALKGDHLLLYLCLILIILLSLARVMPYFSNKFLRKKDLSNRL